MTMRVLWRFNINRDEQEVFLECPETGYSEKLKDGSPVLGNRTVLLPKWIEDVVQERDLYSASDYELMRKTLRDLATLAMSPPSADSFKEMLEMLQERAKALFPSLPHPRDYLTEHAKRAEKVKKVYRDLYSAPVETGFTPEQKEAIRQEAHRTRNFTHEVVVLTPADEARRERIAFREFMKGRDNG